MDKKLKGKLKNDLEKEAKKLRKDLKRFAKEDPKVKGNWRTIFPFFGLNRSHKDEGAEEIEEYENRLPLEYTLELRLKDIETALDKIEKNAYGICENCRKKIQIKRIKAVPEARLCLKCGRKREK